MDLTCIYSALTVALNFWTKLGFLVFVQILIEHLCPDITDVQHKVEIAAPEDLLQSYDFVIIGAGAAGSVLANRLSENAEWSVLLLEAGGSEPILTDVPAFEFMAQLTEVDWQFKTEPMSTACLGMDNHQCNWPRGKVLGGSTVINYMAYVRGNKRDYDHWRDLGNPGWGYDDVLPYFIKSENNSIPDLQNSTYHGKNGYLSVEEYKAHSPITQNFLNAGLELGYNLTDCNGETQTGFMYTQTTLRDGLRCSTAKAFLRPISHRKNLHVSTDSMVYKILVNQITKKTYGVRFRRGGNLYTVYVNKEVILSAGSIQSPQLLMLSGIGPKKHLEEVGVPVIHDSPGVGQNLQDHVTVGGLTYLYDANSTAAATSESSSLVTLAEVKDFLHHKNGSLYAFLGSEAVGYVNSGATKGSLDYPDVQLIFGSTGDNMASFLIKRDLGLKDSYTDYLWKDIKTNSSYGIYPTLLRPKSRGYIKLRNADPNEAPVIHPNYLADQADVDVLVKASQIIYNISQTVAMQKLNPRPNPNVTPQCGKFDASSNAFYECHARHYTMNTHHPSCTCKMGPARDFMAVVDARLRVYGVTGLRVADASIMPQIVSGNINAPTIMIGEKASDLIKEDYFLSPRRHEKPKSYHRRVKEYFQMLRKQRAHRNRG